MALYKNHHHQQQSVLIGVSTYSYSEYDADLHMIKLKKRHVKEYFTLKSTSLVLQFLIGKPSRINAHILFIIKLSLNQFLVRKMDDLK
jgi:hypothetical protein